LAMMAEAMEAAAEEEAREVREGEVLRSSGAEREAWRQAAQDEFDKLRRHTLKPVDVLPRGAKCVPMKNVWTVKLKLGQLRKKCRGVACGNFVSDKGSQNLETDMIDATSVRITSAIAAGNGWVIYTTDVEAAFLEAPLVTEGGEKVYVRCPRSWLLLGVTDDQFFEVDRALYGFRQSPRSWGLKRDRDLRAATVVFEGITYRLRQTDNDSCLWVVQGDGQSKAAGYLGTYVDDYMITCADPGLSEAIIDHLRSLYKLSSVEKVAPYDDATMMFRGFEMSYCGGENLQLSQKTFVNTLLKKYQMEKM